MDPEKIRQNDAERDRLLKLNSWGDCVGAHAPCLPSEDVLFWATKLTECLHDSGGRWTEACQKAWDEMHR